MYWQSENKLKNILRSKNMEITNKIDLRGFPLAFSAVSCLIAIFLYKNWEHRARCLFSCFRGRGTYNNLLILSNG